MSEKEYVAQRLELLRQIREKGIPFNPRKFDTTHTLEEIHHLYGNERDNQVLEKISVRVAGRIRSTRWHGRSCFAHIEGKQASLQLYAREDKLGKSSYRAFTSLDVGDVIGLEGSLFRTRTGELTVLVENWQLLAKCFLPMPERWHGLTDIEIRYRRRYLDLIANKDVRAIFIRRARILRFIRQYLDALGFIEVETPMMQPIYGGALARPFVTHHNTLDMDLYLRIAPELYLKRLIVGNLEKVYELNRCFRNEGVSPQHNPEFTSLELYQAYADYHEIMALTENLISALVIDIFGEPRLVYQGQTIDVTPPWRRIGLRESLIEIGGLEPSVVEDEEALRRVASQLGIPNISALSYGKLLGEVFEKLVEPHLINPTFILDFPVHISPLARKKEDDTRFVERFELFIGGLELANAFSELNDPFEQKKRFEEQVKQREAGDEEAHEMDKDYVMALLYGLPPTGGLGIGIDRLTMLLCDVKSIREVILFPLLRKIDEELPIPEDAPESLENA